MEVGAVGARGSGTKPKPKPTTAQAGGSSTKQWTSAEKAAYWADKTCNKCGQLGHPPNYWACPQHERHEQYKIWTKKHGTRTAAVDTTENTASTSAAMASTSTAASTSAAVASTSAPTYAQVTAVQPAPPMSPTTMNILLEKVISMERRISANERALKE